ncbi:hypothetical protein [Haladaptatus sp. NG-WS-4]
MDVNSHIRYQNQFFVCDSSFQPSPPAEFLRVEFTPDLDIHYSDSLPFQRASDDENELALVGDAVVPNGPPLQNWLEATVSEPLEGVLREAQALTGRYALVYSNDDSATVVPDPLTHKSLYYHTEHELVTSSLKLLFDSVDIEQTENPRVVEFMNTGRFENNESAFIGDKTLYQNLKCVLPNHVLDVDEMRTTRRPLFPPDVQRPPAQYITDRISAVMESFNERYNLFTPITAGRDSRTILACSKDIVDDVTWYTFSNWSVGEHPDVRIPKQIAEESTV